jgi:hypothetical protein
MPIYVYYTTKVIPLNKNVPAGVFSITYFVAGRFLHIGAALNVKGRPVKTKEHDDKISNFIL